MIKTPVDLLWYPCPDDNVIDGVKYLLMTAVTEDYANLYKKDGATERGLNFFNKVWGAQESKYMNSAKSWFIKPDL